MWKRLHSNVMQPTKTRCWASDPSSPGCPQHPCCLSTGFAPTWPSTDSSLVIWEVHSWAPSSSLITGNSEDCFSGVWRSCDFPCLWTAFPNTSGWHWCCAEHGSPRRSSDCLRVELAARRGLVDCFRCSCRTQLTWCRLSCWSWQRTRRASCRQCQLSWPNSASG